MLRCLDLRKISGLFSALLCAALLAGSVAHAEENKKKEKDKGKEKEKDKDKKKDKKEADTPQPALALASRKLEFNRDIRPILSNNCYACHGQDKNTRKGGLRLDVREAALEKTQNDTFAIVPGAPEKSEMIKRLLSTDVEEKMPPKKSAKTVKPEEIEILKQWIKQGAEYQPHWAFLPPKDEPAGKVSDEKWARNPIDKYILAGLDRIKLKPSAEADRATLIRRLSLDIIGLPPTQEEVLSFLNDKSPDAYDKVVDRLLASPHYGERMAVYWLDLVRYADSSGYHSDNPRNVAPYRDYVINAFNQNVKFDQFTTEQIAGDLLPNATLQQKVASGYNRLILSTEEGGAQAKEYEAKNNADKVRNTASVWLGLTMGCCECHDHKFDPLTMKDFYNFAAFFADVREAAIGRREDGMLVPTPAQEPQLKKMEEEIAQLKQQLDASTPELLAAQREWEANPINDSTPAMSPWQVIGPFKGADFGAAYKEKYGPERVLKDPNLSQAFDGKKWEVKEDLKDETVHNVLNEENSAYYLYRSITVTTPRPLNVSLGSDDGIKVWHNGKQVLAKEALRAAAADQEKVTLALTAGKNDLIMKIVNGGGQGGFYFKAGGAGVPKNILDIVKLEADKRNDAQKAELAKYYRSIAPLLAPVRDKLAHAEAAKTEFEKSIPRCLVSVSEKPRTIRVLPRGNWMDDSGEVCEPHIPALFKGPQPEAGKRLTRLDLAKWIMDEKNPLTARVFVNRAWKLFFGQGISKVLDDLGIQGEWPTHPELLDHLALEFQKSGWDMKKMVKYLVSSSTYRQSSFATKEMKEIDPYNRYYARQSRFRLEAEFIRDNALAVSGLLSRTIGGPSVKPYQPAGYWVHLNFPTREWTNDKGENLYRRGVYTWWQRSFLHPSLLAFDGNSREECCAERTRSNTPQQALVLLNDPTYVEAARIFAEKIMKEGGASASDRIDWAFLRTVARKARPDEQKILHELFSKHHEQYKQDTKSAELMVSAGASPVPKEISIPELAAWTSLARTILNLHETITRN
ncbi:MAG TPA: PSD1 and planctomycete cytochrome C domain-containing protein [Planctomycetota bacterium]|nr:PSD1 and planctomycete cytochrome C domain-containing protein [Planctomycetota bacterium]